MPTEAFYKLDSEKRDLLLESAVHEFSENPYDKVSIFKIAQNADVSRSGFYYYFKDKRDIYLYLINEIKEQFISTYNFNERYVELITLSKNIFSFVTSIKETKWEKFFRRMVTDMKSSDLKTLFTFLNKEKPLCGMECCIGSVKLVDPEQLKEVVMLMGISIMFSLSGYLDNECTLECAEERLEQMFDIIRHGIEKEV